MVLLVAGLRVITSNMATSMTTGQGGTGTTLFVSSQTGLITPVAGSSTTLADKTASTTTISVTHFMDTSTGNGSTYSEWGVSNGSTFYNRAVKAGRLKDDSIEMSVVHTFEFEIVV